METKSDYIRISSYEGRIGEVKRVVLLYSGGLDTSCMLKWLQDTYKAEVVALTLDLGQQGDDLEAVRKKALKLGAVKAYVIDAKEEFANEYLAPLILANGSYQGDYHISTVSRYLMAKWAVVVAYREKADAVAHGCTGKGNDQVRIDGAVLTLDPNMKIVAPVREWNMDRQEEIEYALKYHIPVPATKASPYSVDDNMWGMTWEGGEIEDPKLIPAIAKIQKACRLVEKTPNKSEFVRLTFKKGIPIALNGKTMSLAKIIISLNVIAGKHGVGVVYHLEDRLVGLKNRGVYEHPAGHVIIEAHRNLEKYVCTRMENEVKAMLDLKWGYLCYGAVWYDPVMIDIHAFNKKLNEKVSGDVTVKLFKGNTNVVSIKSPYGLHHASFAREAASSYNTQASAAFIEVYSTQMRLSQQKAEKTALVSIGLPKDKQAVLPSVKKLVKLGFIIFATEKTHVFLSENGLTNYLIYKISQKGKKPNLRTMLDERGFDLIINTSSGDHSKQEATDGRSIRDKALESKTKLFTDIEIAEKLIDKMYEKKFGHDIA